MSSDTTYSVYFAGALMDHKDLIGNALLARHVARSSKGRFNFFLPQDNEQIIERAVQVRDRDLMAVISAELCLFNFDGAELDSGTVVEFMLAKMLDIPSVILRTDFRQSGDGNKDSDGKSWNLMCSGYPRSKVVLVHGMELYQKYLNGGDYPVDQMYADLSGQVVQAFDQVLAERPVYPLTLVQLEELHRWAIRFAGMTMANQFDLPSIVRPIIFRKLGKGLYVLNDTPAKSNAYPAQ